MIDGISNTSALKGRPFFLSFSGGKDCCLALHRALRAGGRPKFLLNMCCPDGERSRSHGLRIKVVMAQARALGIPLKLRRTDWSDYERNFLAALAEMEESGVTHGVFGDIDLVPHREWVERVCAEAGVIPHEPLWGEPRRKLLEEFLEAGFAARIVSVRSDILPVDMLGRLLNRALIAEIEALGVDASGEGGEYHTVVTGGPLFGESLVLTPGGVFEVAGCFCLDFTLAGGE